MKHNFNKNLNYAETVYATNCVSLCVCVSAAGRNVNWNPQSDLSVWIRQRSERDAHLTSNMDALIEKNMR